MENKNLLDFNNDILNIIGGYVIEDNIKRYCWNKWIKMYTKKKIIKNLLEFNNDILNIICGYVIEDNI